MGEDRVKVRWPGAQGTAHWLLAGAGNPVGWGEGCPQDPQLPPTHSLLLPCSGCRFGDVAGTMRQLRALLCLCLLAQVALASRVRTRRELAPGLYEHGVYDAGGSYCQRGDVCCHGRDDGCTVPYQDTLCYCDLFCNRTISDCCPDFWEYCLGIPAPFPKAPGEAAPAQPGRGLWVPMCSVMPSG